MSNLLKKEKDNGDKMCFGCSQSNPIGLKLTFTMDDSLCRTQFVAGEEHQGWGGYMHGGLIAALLDETMAWWLWMQKIPSMTAEMTTRYSLGVPIKTNLIIESWCEEEKKDRLFIMAARIILPDKRVAASARGKFMRIDPTQSS